MGGGGGNWGKWRGGGIDNGEWRYQWQGIFLTIIENDSFTKKSTLLRYCLGIYHPQETECQKENSTAGYFIRTRYNCHEPQ